MSTKMPWTRNFEPQWWVWPLQLLKIFYPLTPFCTTFLTTKSLSKKWLYSKEHRNKSTVLSSTEVTEFLTALHSVQTASFGTFGGKVGKFFKPKSVYKVL